jgi:tetratricopeptide (TPR) repeat protein
MNVKTAKIEAFYALAAQDYDGVVRACRQGLYQAPDMAELHLIMAHASVASGRFAEAARSLEAASRSEPQSLRIRCAFATVLESAGEENRAIQEYRLVLEQDPRHVLARYNLATLLAAQGDAAGAIQEYQELIRQEPDCVQAHNNLGVLLSAIGDPDGAIASFERSRRACPGDAVSAVNLAREWAVKGELRRAEEALAEALDVAPEFGEALALSGWLSLQQGHYPQAEQAYRRALAAGFDTPETREGHLLATQRIG